MKVTKLGTAPYGHNCYEVRTDGGTLLGTVTGGGRPTAGADRWWKADAVAKPGEPWGKTFRYLRDRREAIETLIAHAAR